MMEKFGNNRLQFYPDKIVRRDVITKIKLAVN